MSKSKEFSINIYDLLPALYRLEDAKRGRPLQALLDIISKQADIVKQDIDGLWDDLFIETCADWVIPYIGDLVGNNPLHEVAQRRRVDVAKTIYYRRRKGTLPMLEELARDVTGWKAHAVIFFELLGWTQNLNHLRFSSAPNLNQNVPNASDRVGTVNLRNFDVLDRLDSPFDIISHTADVRPMGRLEGWHNIRKIGFFLWRLNNYPLEGITPCKASDNGYDYHFSPLGNPAPLFNYPAIEADEAGLAGEIHVPSPIRPIAFQLNPADYYGPDKSLAIYRGTLANKESLIPLEDIICKDLSSWERPPQGVAVDVHLGRIAFSQVPTDGITVSYNYGFSANMGGGPYDRPESLNDSGSARWHKTVSKHNQAADYDSISLALDAWANPLDGKKADAVITVLDNGTYEEEISIEPSDDCRLVIRAENRFRSVLKKNLIITGNHPNAAFSLVGLVIEGGIQVQGTLGELEVQHCTLVPGGSLTDKGKPSDSDFVSIDVTAPNERMQMVIENTISGRLRLPKDMRSLAVRDSILDSFGGVAISSPDGHNFYASPTMIERSTVLGEVWVKELLLASETIFMGEVKVLRKQAGCVWFSYLPNDNKSQTPRRYRCQPDLALKAVADSEKEFVSARLVPSFTSRDYGHPGYGQLALNCAKEIRTGAEDGSEMGAFCKLKQPQRELNLSIRLEEYLPFGLEAGIVYVT